MKLEITEKQLEETVNTIKFLSVDGIQKASSGHPGLPMGAAYYAFTLWFHRLRFNPQHPKWVGRDRFVLSAGHGSMLLYSLLHLFKYDLKLDDLKNFRQLGSPTPGHPEYGETPGVEVTTGPLGQGFANAVGMAISAKNLAAHAKKDFAPLLDQRIFVVCGDGDMMEGISSEAASLAGHLGLGNLVYFYDDNHITIEGDTNVTFSEDVAARFKSYNWQVISVDPYNRESILDGIDQGVAETNKPTLLIGRTNIAKGSPNKQDTASAHGEPLGDEEIRLTKKGASWSSEQSFHVPDEVSSLLEKRVNELKAEYKSWQEAHDIAEKADPKSAELIKAMLSQKTAPGIKEKLLAAVPEKPTATRASSGIMLQLAAAACPALIGGSADLAPSTKTWIKDESAFTPENSVGRNLHFGVREHAMGAVLNGMSLFGAHMPYGSTFLTFSDYYKPSLRLAALMKLKNIHIFTHDSFCVGEDGPTHQPIEHFMMLRALPGLTVIRPADALEVAGAWDYILNSAQEPVVLALSRQNLPLPPQELRSNVDLSKGGYVLKDWPSDRQDIILVATGSEVSLALETADLLEKEGQGVRVVSLPSWEIFEKQDKAYRDKVLPPDCQKRATIEAGITMGWERYATTGGITIGLNRFGASAPYKDLLNLFGFTAEKIVARIKKEL